MKKNGKKGNNGNLREERKRGRDGKREIDPNLCNFIPETTWDRYQGVQDMEEVEGGAWEGFRHLKSKFYLTF